MSNEQPERDNEQPEQKVSKEDFAEYFGLNTKLTNVELYEKFPNNPTSTIRRWKSDILNSETTVQSSEQAEQKPKTKKDDPYLKEAIKAYMRDTTVPKGMLDGLDDASKLVVLKNAAQNKRPDPNLSTIGTPSASGSQKKGIDQYLTIDEKAFRMEGKGTVNFEIPASVAYDPELNNKKNLIGK